MSESFGTCAIHILHGKKKFCDYSCATWVTHKSEKSGGAFKAIPAIPMCYSGMLNSDLGKIEGWKESCMWIKCQDYKYDLQKHSNMKNSGEFLKV